MARPRKFEEGSLPTIEKLFPRIELFSDGEPRRNTLFVLGKGIGPGSEDELLLVDPPLNAAEIFVLPPRTAAICTGEPQPVAALSLVQTEAGGLAHLRVGEHLLDVYSQAQGNVVLLPLLGLLCSGSFASDVLPPCVGIGSDGGAELDTLRLLALLVRERKLQLLLPHVGTPAAEPVAMMERLADDVAYLHELRRVVPALAQKQSGLPSALALGETLLPKARASAAGQARHAANITVLYLVAENRQN